MAYSLKRYSLCTLKFLKPLLSFPTHNQTKRSKTFDRNEDRSSRCLVSRVIGFKVARNVLNKDKVVLLRILEKEKKENKNRILTELNYKLVRNDEGLDG